jgi:hypothetical protein
LNGDEHVGDNARKGAVRKRTQLCGKVMGESNRTELQGDRQVHGSDEAASEEEIQGRPPREEGR